MSNFQFILRDWVKTSGFLTHELVKRFFLLYPLLCIASNCYLQILVNFEAWFETPDAAPESQAPVPPATWAPDISASSAEGHLMHTPSRESGRHMIAIEPETNGGTAAEEPVDVEGTVRSFFTEGTNEQEPPESHPENQN